MFPVGIDILKAPGATGDYHTNLKSKADTLINEMTREGSQYTFGFIHVKGKPMLFFLGPSDSFLSFFFAAVDDAGHDRNVGLKVKFLQEVDKMIEHILSNLHSNEKEQKNTFSICITGDHSTPVLSGDHSYEPVPFSICKVTDAYQYYLNRQSGNKT